MIKVLQCLAILILSLLTLYIFKLTAIEFRKVDKEKMIKYHRREINGNLQECVDGVIYLVGYRGTLTLKVDRNNKPVSCDF